MRTNPVTGWKSVFALGPFPKKINELHSDESEELLKKLLGSIPNAHDLQVRLKWKNENDLAIWDNRSVFHTATFDYDGIGERAGHRAVGIGERYVMIVEVCVKGVNADVFVMLGRTLTRIASLERRLLRKKLVQKRRSLRGRCKVSRRKRRCSLDLHSAILMEDHRSVMMIWCILSSISTFLCTPCFGLIMFHAYSAM